MEGVDWFSESRRQVYGSCANALRASVGRTEQPLSLEDCSTFFGAFVVFEPPRPNTHPRDSDAVGFVVQGRGGAGGGYTLRPGRIFLNFKRLMEGLASTTLYASAVADKPWLLPFAGLLVLRDLLGDARVQVGDLEASIVWTLWLSRGGLQSSELLAKCSKERRRHGLDRVADDDFNEALSTLDTLGVIERHGADQETWQLSEHVCVDYLPTRK